MIHKAEKEMLLKKYLYESIIKRYIENNLSVFAITSNDIWRPSEADDHYVNNVNVWTENRQFTP